MSQGIPGTEYKPRPGSCADLALQHLRAHGRTGRDALAVAIDKPGDEIRALLSFPINLGAIVTGLDANGKCWFDVGQRVVHVPPNGASLSKPAQAKVAEARADADGFTCRTHAYAGPGRCPYCAGVMRPRMDAPPAGPADKVSPRMAPAAEERAITREGASGAACLAPNTPAQDSQLVLKAEAARPDATDRETPATASPVGGPMGAGQPAAAGPPVDEPALRQLVQLLGEEPDGALIRGGDLGRRAPDDAISRLWVALGSDGCLVIRRGGKCEVFDRAETREIARYFSAIGVEAWGCA